MITPDPPTPALVSFSRRRLDESPIYGFIVGQSELLLAIHRVSDRYDLDGYSVFPRGQLGEVTEVFERSDLIRRAIRLKNQTPIPPAAVSLESLRDLLQSAQEQYGVLVIAREHRHIDEVEVGTVRMSSDSTYVLRWLDPNACWSNDDRAFLFEDITKVEFGGEYETTLLAVANDRERESSA